MAKPSVPPQSPAIIKLQSPKYGNKIGQIIPPLTTATL